MTRTAHSDSWTCRGELHFALSVAQPLLLALSPSKGLCSWPTRGGRGMEGTTERKEGKALNDQRTIAKSTGPITSQHAQRRRELERR